MVGLYISQDGPGAVTRNPQNLIDFTKMYSSPMLHVQYKPVIVEDGGRHQSDQGTQAKGSFISTWSPWSPRLWEGCGEDSTSLEGHYPDTCPFCLHFIGQSNSHWTSREQGSERLSWKYLVNSTNDHYTSLSLTRSFIWQIHTEHRLCMYGALEIQQG